MSGSYSGFSISAQCLPPNNGLGPTSLQVITAPVVPVYGLLGPARSNGSFVMPNMRGATGDVGESLRGYLPSSASILHYALQPFTNRMYAGNASALIRFTPGVDLVRGRVEAVMTVDESTTYVLGAIATTRNYMCVVPQRSAVYAGISLLAASRPQLCGNRQRDVFGWATGPSDLGTCNGLAHKRHSHRCKHIAPCWHSRIRRAVFSKRCA